MWPRKTMPLGFINYMFLISQGIGLWRTPLFQTWSQSRGCEKGKGRKSSEEEIPGWACCCSVVHLGAVIITWTSERHSKQMAILVNYHRRRQAKEALQLRWTTTCFIKAKVIFIPLNGEERWEQQNKYSLSRRHIYTVTFLLISTRGSSFSEY